MTISIQETKKILGDMALEYTDLQLEAIINSFVVIADLAIDDFLDKRTSAKKTTDAIGRIERSQSDA